MKNTSSKTAQRNSTRAKVTDRSPPRLLPAQLRSRLAPLHRALRAAIPELDGRAPLSSSSMDEAFHRAISSVTVSEAKQHYLDANLMKRYVGADLSDASSRVNNAVDALLDSEVRCRYTNQVFAGGLDLSNAHIPLHLLPVLKRARRIVGGILGRFDMDAFPRACGFTPGATTEFPRRGAALHHKWARAAHVTLRAVPYAEAFIAWANLPGFGRDLIIDQRNSVFTVPKNFERDRTACRPVSWNGFLQKGVGTMIRRRAARVEGLLQPDAQHYHRVLAKVGSATGLLSTRDLKGASDSIALAVVECLVPPDWCKVLFDLREPEGVLPDGRVVCWEKISSMGNGFTFELETILFYALVRACCRKESLVSVYGDDIIFPTRHVELVDEVLSFCGFEINREKSFSQGLFRESCGGHYFGGEDVKPFYLQDMPRTLGDVINLHNDIVRWHVGYPRPDTRWFQTWRTCRQIVPRSFWGPSGVEGTLWCEWDEARPTYVPEYQAFRVASTTLAIESTEDLSGPLDPDVEQSASFVFGAYLQKLWMKDPEPWQSSETSKFRTTGAIEKSAWLYVDRVQWNRLTAETLCT